MTLSLDYPTEAEIGWLLDQDISDTAILEPEPLRAGKVRFLGKQTFDFARFSDIGERALVIVADEDLIAWQPRTGTLATWRGATFALGQEAIFNPATYFSSGALHVHETPLQWLQADRQGIVIVRPGLCHAYLAHCPRLASSDTGFARKVQAWVQPRKPTVQILVGVKPDRAAA
jgi:hypothetical protein